MANDSNREKIRLLSFTLSVTVLITAIKFISWRLTLSNAILTDAFESIINVVAGGFALFSAWFAAQPKDESHPYGHGKIEFLSAGFEGGLVLLAGLSMVAWAAYSLFQPVTVHALDKGMILSGAAGIGNFFLGTLLIRRGRKHNSLLMVADGRHLISDTITTVGLLAGIAIIWITGLIWLDNVVAILFGCLILITGFRLVKESVAGLLDETDYVILGRIIQTLEENRTPRWIDFHNMRVQKYGSSLHVDCHLTLPWYLSLEEAHAEVHKVEEIIQQHFDNIEFFIHSDPCIPESCLVCQVMDCKVRKGNFVKKVDWKLDNLMENKKHTA